MPPSALRAFDFDRLAYIKILESDWLSTSETQFSLVSASSCQKGLTSPVQETAINVCIYTRKGKEFGTMRGGIKGMNINGYSELFPLKTDNITPFWHSIEAGHSFRIAFHSSETAKPFRIRDLNKLCISYVNVGIPANSINYSLMATRSVSFIDAFNLF